MIRLLPRTLILLLLILGAPAFAAPVDLATRAPIKRSKAQRAAFQREHPCPATGQPRGPCPGWRVDHIVPLACGGADAPANMQWLTVAEHKAKSGWERKDCVSNQMVAK